MNKISAIINTYNESHLLKDCLESIKGLADEIIVGDMMSTDGSAELAEKYGCKVIKYPHKEIVEETLIERINRTSFDWILMLDPDNRLPVQTAERLKEIVRSDEADVVEFYYRIKVFGNFVKHGHDSGGYHVRFFKKSALLLNGKPEVKMHSMVIDPLRKNTKRWLRLDRVFYIEHLAYDNVSKCLEQHLKYAKIEAEERFARGERFSFFNLGREISWKFMLDFIYRPAFLSGMSAVIYSAIAELMILQIHFLLWEKSRK